MDFFDPKKQKRHAIRLSVGYALIALALILTTTILLYQAYGYGVDRNGKVIQNGLVFMSSRPEGGDVYLDGELYKSQTNTRMTLPAGQHTVRITREGYRNWQRAITVEGGSVERFDYPLLYPSKLATAVTKQYEATPGLVSQSDDQRWMLVALPSANTFDLFDLKAAKPVAKALTLPTDVLSEGETTGWQEVQWADDNRHVVLLRNYKKNGNTASEYILLDRADATQTKNLSQLMGFTPSVLELRKGDYDSYFAYDSGHGTVFRASLEDPTPQLYLENVIGFAADEDTVLYATTQNAQGGKALLTIRKGDDPAYTLRTVLAGTPYLLDLAVYDGAQYVAAGTQGEGKVYVYQNPIAVLKRTKDNIPAPVQILKVESANYVDFSENARFVMAESGSRFSVYDAETDRGYSYRQKVELDQPGTHALWLDGYHLSVVSGGKVYAFDFDGANTQSLMASNPAFLRALSPNSKFIYAVNGQNALTGTSLLTPKDQ